jgi:hypothetical protein
MQMHEAEIVEDAAWVVGAVAVRIIAVRVRDHRFRTILPSARPRAPMATGPLNTVQNRASIGICSDANRTTEPVSICLSRREDVWRRCRPFYNLQFRLTSATA